MVYSTTSYFLAFSVKESVFILENFGRNVVEFLGIEDLPTLSNRGVKGQNLGLFKNSSLNLSESMFSVSIDKISLVGKIKPIKNSFYNGVDEYYNIDDLGELFARYGKAKSTGQGWQIVNKYGEQIFYMNIPKYSKENKGRIEFNPNNLNDFLQKELKEFIKLVFEEVHFTRVDIAFDMVNVPNEVVYGYNHFGKHKTGYKLNYEGKRETVEYGTRQSEKRVILYNKLLERVGHKISFKNDIQTWWRLEFQFRKAKESLQTDLKGKMVEFLKDFICIENENIIGLKTNDKMYLTALKQNPILFNELSKNTKKKYKELLRRLNKTNDNSLSKALNKLIDKKYSEVENELESWLIRVDLN